LSLDQFAERLFVERTIGSKRSDKSGARASKHCVSPCLNINY